MSYKHYQSFVMAILICTTFSPAFASLSLDEYENKKFNDPFFSDCQQILYLNNLLNEASQIIVPILPDQEKELLLAMTVLGHGYLFFCSTIEYQNTTDMIGLHQQLMRYYYELSLVSDFEWKEWKYGNPQHFTLSVSKN